jgi:Cdc6-like AAA superfamily ATPase
MDLPPYSMLWIHGAKGAGKTFLTSRIIDKLFEMHPEDSSSTIISYFYCRSENGQSKDGFCLKILKSLIRQIISRKPDLLPALNKRRANGRVEILDDESTAKSILKELCDQPSRHFIIIDGVDEMERSARKSVVQFLSSIVQRVDGYDPGRVRLLLVSTDLYDLRAHAKTVDHLEIYSIQPHHTHKDIEIYLQRQSDEWKSNFCLSDEELARTRSAILERAGGKSEEGG